MLDAVACGEELWWTGVIQTAGLGTMFVVVFFQVLFEYNVSEMSVNDLIATFILAPGTALILAIHVWGRIRIELGYLPLKRCRLRFLGGISWTRNRMIGFVWFMNVTSLIFVPLLSLALFIQFLLWLSARSL